MVLGDWALSVLLVTKKSGYPLWGEVWPDGDQLRHGRTAVDERFSRLYDRFRECLISPAEYSALRQGSEMEEKYPNLHWHLTSDQNDDGRPRERSRLNVWVERERWKGFVRDMNTRYLLWGDGVDYESLMYLLEARLADRTQRLWRKDKFFHGDTKRD